jgi:hypothetical protein
MVIHLPSWRIGPTRSGLPHASAGKHRRVASAVLLVRPFAPLAARSSGLLQGSPCCHRRSRRAARIFIMGGRPMQGVAPAAAAARLPAPFHVRPRRSLCEVRFTVNFCVRVRSNAAPSRPTSRLHDSPHQHRRAASVLARANRSIWVPSSGLPSAPNRCCDPPVAVRSA